MAGKPHLSRKQWSRILGDDYDAIRQFEELFSTTGTMSIQADSSAAGTVYPVWVAGTGDSQPCISPGKLAFTPSTGAMVAGSFNGITGLATALPLKNTGASLGTSPRAAHEDHRHDDGWATGDVKFTLATVAPTGWVLMNDGTIGDGSSSATTRANDDCHSLFVLIWNGTLDAWCPVSGGRGASAEADWSAHKMITLPRALGRALAVAGAGSGLTSRALGEYLGEEAHVLVTPEMPKHTHIQDPHTHTVAYASNPHTAGAAVNNSVSASGATTPSGSTTATNQDTGGDGAHNNMQPTLFLTVMVHL